MTEKISIIYNNKEVKAYRLTVSSHIAIDAEKAWELVKTSALLEFITKGKVKFKPIEGEFPKIWTQGSLVQTKMLLYGWLPFGGVHTLYIENIDKKTRYYRPKNLIVSARFGTIRFSLKRLTARVFIIQTK